MLQAGALSIPEPLARALCALRRHLGCQAAPTLLLPSVMAVEAEVGCSIPTGVLALYAALGRPVIEIAQVADELPTFYRSSGQAAPGVLNHVAFDADGEWPRMYGCWRRGAARDSDGVTVWSLKKNVPWGETTLPRYCCERWELDPNAALALPSEEVDAFSPLLIAPAPAPARTVAHATFGTGRVLEELGDKLRIDFGPQGVRVLLARFVTETGTDAAG